MSRIRNILIVCLLCSALDFLKIAQAVQTDEPAQTRTSASAATNSAMPVVVKAAFEKVHDGWSSDEVVLKTELNEKFIAECQTILPAALPVDLNWTLLNMRKAGLLKIRATQRDSQPLGQFAPLAEIAARHVFDQYKVSTDRMMCDPEMRRAFDECVLAIDADSDLYRVRKSAFQLRKQRQLQPELVARIADWGRKIESFPSAQVRDEPSCVPALPGIYIFRDQTGYLYIGQSDNLNQRMKEHLHLSSNFSLAQYLADQGNDNTIIEFHSFPADSRAKETMIRRAYESELIASRKPRFNIQP